MNTKRLFRLCIAPLAPLFAAAICISAPAVTPTMTTHYINVGQGAAALLEFPAPCGLVLIDTGGDDESTGKVLAYLENVFARRPELNRTLESVVITHPHKDHALGLIKVMETFNVKRYVDDGETTGSGKAGPRWVRKEVEAGRRQTKIVEIDDAKITGKGLTNGDIDPIKCDAFDPLITILAGGLETKPASWTDRDFDNLNNHSVVVRIDFGKSSFLFSGDLEEAGISHLLKRYRRTAMLDVDVYTVGHHGAANASNAAFLAAITPEIAVISMGKWDDGMRPRFNPFSTYAYGHPRRVILDLLAEFIEADRPTTLTVKAGEGAKNFVDYTVEKMIYATGWDDDVRIAATLDGKYEVIVSKPAMASPVGGGGGSN